MSNKRYIEVYSAYRDRNQYPIPAEFEVILAQSGSATIASNAKDPILDSYPYYSFIGNSQAAGPLQFNGGTFYAPILNILASNIDNYYNGYTITDTTIGETRMIIGYIGATNTVELDGAFNHTWAATDNYTIQDPSTNAVVQLQYPASLVPNFYINSLLRDETIGQSRLITAYDGPTRTATLSSAFGGGWALTDSYTLREGDPSEVGVLQAGSTNITAVLSVVSSSVTDYYKDSYIYITSGPATGNVRLIKAYNGTTKVATVTMAFSAVPVAGNSYEILQFSRDNYRPLVYTGSTVSQQQEVCYEIELISLMLPNVILRSGFGSRIVYYPYVYVEFGSSTNGVNNSIIYTNNPNATKALFIAPITDVSQPESSQFMTINGSGMVQTIKFKPNDNFRFRVFLPDGETFLTEPDNFSPLPPNLQIQITAVFSIRKV